MSEFRVGGGTTGRQTSYIIRTSKISVDTLNYLTTLLVSTGPRGEFSVQLLEYFCRFLRMSNEHFYLGKELLSLTGVLSRV